LYDVIFKHRKKGSFSEKLTLSKLYDKDALMRNYDAYKPRLRCLKGVNIGGYDGNYA